MLTKHEIAEIGRRGRDGESPAAIARSMGLTYSQLRYEVGRVGKAIRQYWDVVDLSPADELDEREEVCRV